MCRNITGISLITLVFVIFSFGVASAKDDFGTIRGKITAKGTGEPLYMANVVVKGKAIGAPSASDGVYTIMRAPVGRYSIMVSYIGYKVQVRKVSVTANDTIIVDFALEEDLIQVDQIVVTGNRIPTFIGEVPVRTEVITRKELDDKGAVNLYEALEGLPGIRVEQQCSSCNFSMVRMQGLGPDHVQVMIDGQPIYSGLASVYGLQQVPTENIERIEVVKGAGSALYGAKAIAGVVNVITKEAGKQPSLQLHGNFAAYNTNEYSLTAATRIEQMDAVMTAQKNTGDEIDENGDGHADRVRTDNIALSGKINIHRVLGFDRITVTGRSINESRLGGIIETFENPFAEMTERINTKRYEAGLSMRRAFDLGNELIASFNFVSHNRNATNDGFLGDYMDTHDDEIPPVDEFSPYIADEHLYVADLQYSHPLPGGQRLLAGAQYSRNNLDEEGRYVIVDDEDPDYGATYTSQAEKYADDYGVFIQDEIDIGERLDLVVGARYDIHRSKDDFGGSGSIGQRDRVALEYREESFNPRGAVRYKIGDMNLRASVGTGFRVPYGFSEDLHLCSGSPRVNKPAGLEPEKSISYNLSVDYAKSRFNLGVNLFRTDLKNKIDYTDAGEDSKRLGYTYEWANIGDAYTQGIELSARILVLNYFNVDLEFAYTDARYSDERLDWAQAHPEFADDSRFISRVPETAGGIKLNFNPRNLNAVVDVDYTGPMYIDYYQGEDIEMAGSRIKRTDPFVIVNMKLAAEIERWGVTPFVGVKNLFDYVQGEKYLDDAAYIWAPWVGRIVYGGFELAL